MIVPPGPHSSQQTRPVRPCLFIVRRLHYGLNGHSLRYASHIQCRVPHIPAVQVHWSLAAKSLTRLGQNVRPSLLKPSTSRHVLSANERRYDALRIAPHATYWHRGQELQITPCIYDARVPLSLPP